MNNKIYIYPDLGSTATVIQKANLKFSQVIIDASMLILVKQGKKLIKRKDKIFVVEAGQAVAIAAGEVLDITNHIPDAGGHYEALWLTWDQSLVDRYAEVNNFSNKNSISIHFISHLSLAFSDAIEEARDCLCDQASIPKKIAEHRLTEPLIWLAQANSHFAPTSPPPFSTQIRQTIKEALSYPWTAEDIAKRSAISEATLRRRLAKENTTFSDILIDTKMSHALTLLQCTNKPISHIASAVGYDSPSRFTVRFKDRFNFLPSEIRGHRIFSLK